MEWRDDANAVCIPSLVDRFIRASSGVERVTATVSPQQLLEGLEVLLVGLPRGSTKIHIPVCHRFPRMMSCRLPALRR